MPGLLELHVGIVVMTRVDWSAVLDDAATVVASYDTSVTLRQLFYRLVSAQLLPNTTPAYKTLSARTAEARREGWFPPLIDRGRAIHRYATDTSPTAALEGLASRYRRDRTEGQKFALYLAVEKNGLVNQLMSWFADLGVPVLACGGYSSQSYVDVIAHHADEDGRPAVLLFAGDFDPSGEDIDRDLVERTDCWHDVVRVALTADQVESYGLPANPGKASDSRAAGFVARHGELVQVEVDALDPTDLRALFQSAIDEFWDASAFEAVVARETTERSSLLDLAENFTADADNEEEER